MKTAEEILKEYDSIKEKVKTEFSNGKNVKRKKELRDEYIKTLPINKQLAVWLSDNTNGERPSNWGEFQFGEVIGIEDNWEGRQHQRFLYMANQLLSKTNDINLIKTIVSITNPFEISLTLSSTYEKENERRHEHQFIVDGHWLKELYKKEYSDKYNDFDDFMEYDLTEEISKDIYQKAKTDGVLIADMRDVFYED